MKAAQGLIILVVLLALGGIGALTLSTTKKPSQSPAPSPSSLALNKALQLGGFAIPTPTPPPATPAPSTSVLPEPSASPPNFSASTLDWEDVVLVLNQNGAMSSLSSGCQNDLSQATYYEFGNSNGSGDPLPGSRVFMCLTNNSCQTQGYNSYNGQQPLPSFVPSASCQAELTNVFTKYVNAGNYSGGSTPLDDVMSPNNTNCDPSDDICVSRETFCRAMQTDGTLAGRTLRLAAGC